jgi:hypothetical protein
VAVSFTDRSATAINVDTGSCLVVITSPPGVNAQFSRTGEFQCHPHETAGRRDIKIGSLGDTMLNNATDHDGSAVVRTQLTRMRALLDMFEEDRGRPPNTIEELRDWMGAQYIDQLQIRMDGWLRGIDR